MNSCSKEIDFVLPWVDGSDPVWRAEREKYKTDDSSDKREIRYRDWDILQYWFRGVERYTPWVNRIHFVTWGHLPKWLNTNHPKLHIVKQDDFIPQAYSPTFNCQTIEMNMHRIEGLSEQFVYFNDDIFLLQPVSPEQFFKNGLPCDGALMNPVYTNDLSSESGDDRIYYIIFNDIQYLNRQYQIRDCIRRHPGKWFNIKYGTHLIRNVLLVPWPRFTGFVVEHQGIPFLKSSFEKCWKDASDVMDATSRRRFRSMKNIDYNFIRFCQFAEGRFVPSKPLRTKYTQLNGQNTEEICHTIQEQQYKMVCVNDGPKVGLEFEPVKQQIKAAFETVFPDKSSFEVD